jgi:hypothetical protein
MKRYSARLFNPTIVAVAISVLVLGCLDADRPYFKVSNRLDQPIDVTYVRGPDTQVKVIHDLTPGLEGYVNSFVRGGECDDASLIATDASGEVVARFEGPVCDGTEWIVERPVP